MWVTGGFCVLISGSSREGFSEKKRKKSKRLYTFPSLLMGRRSGRRGQGIFCLLTEVVRESEGLRIRWCV